MSDFWGVLIAYLAGSIPVGYLLVSWKRDADVRTLGSGDTGAVNVTRVLGWRFGAAVLVWELAVAYGAVWLTGWLTGHSELMMSAAAFAAMLANAFPIFLEFRGGKAAAAGVGAFLCLMPWAVAAALFVFAAMVLATRYISAGSVVAALSFPLAAWLIAKPAGVPMVAAVLAAVLVVWRHDDNLRRMHAGAEPVIGIGWKRRRDRAQPFYRRRV